MALLYLLLGLAGLTLGSDLAVRGSVSVAHHFRWPPWIAGLLLLALGTSLPELFVCAVSAPEHPGLAVGNVMGSNAFNVFVVLGMVVMLKRKQRLDVTSVRLPTLLPLAFGSLMAFTLLFMPLASYRFSLLFLVGYGVMVFTSMAHTKVEELEGEVPDVHWRLPLGVVAALVGFGMLAGGSQSFLSGALGMAEIMGWSEGFAGYVITAVGTSAPELFTSLRALRLGHAGAVFGNVVGSNAFNLLLAGGVIGLVAQTEVPQTGLRAQLWSNLAATVVVVLPACSSHLRRPLHPALGAVLGALMVLAYAGVAWWIWKSG